ncbi:signal peptidase I [uncultured Leifsonia sp.]|uniref:signal peptidase I n=1 Tax=Leifsonia sp. TaxID=1870902 RepID=UPI0028D1DDE6|nr:signal peptidase I [uncultured Leifsonia sp.]
MTDETLPTRPDRVADSERKRRGALLFLRDILIIVVIALLVSFLIKTFVVRSFYIPSGSMENTLQISDKIIVNELQPSVFPLSRGDVVVFRDPGGWLPPKAPVQRNPVASAVDTALTFVGLSASDSDDHLVKRLIGLPGDRVACCDAAGRITVNGVAIDEPYTIIEPGQTNAATVRFAVTVPAGAIWVMGDNRYNSQDSSRNQSLPGHGFVPLDHVVGRAFVVSWPVQRWSWLDDYPEVFRGVEENKE